MAITIKKSQHNDGTRIVYDGPRIIATISKHPNWRSEKKPDAWNVCRLTGRVDWFSSFSDASCDAMKG